MEGKTELQRNAIVNARLKELETYQRALDMQWLDSRMEDGRMGRCLALIQREADMEKDFQERTDHAAIVNARAQKETALAIEVAKERREAACQLLRRHQLRESDPSLRALAQKLQAGYVCRDLKQQILNNEYRKLQDKAEEHRANAILNNAQFNEQQAAEDDERQKMSRATQYRHELQQQLVNRQRQKQCQYEDTLIEKKMLDEIMRTLSDEDQRELQQKRELVAKLQAEMVTFKKARDAWKEKQKRMVVLEETQIEAQKKQASDRSAATIAERNRKMRIKEEINQKITAKILADEAERQDRENIIKMLQEQEYLEKNANDDVSERRQKERVRSETKEALTEQMETRRRLEREQREREKDFRRETEAKMAAENAKEFERERKVREKNREYCAELRRQMEEDALRRRRRKEEEEERARQVWEHDTAWREEVTEERKKIIEEHVPQLLGYLQAGVINKEDIPTVRAGANKREDLANLDIEGMAISKRPQRFSKCNAQCRVLREF